MENGNIKTLSSLKQYIGEHVWIYNWNAAREQFYCIPVLKGDKENGIARDPIAVNLSANFSLNYNHLVIVTHHPEEFQQRLALISKLQCNRVEVLDEEGHLIMKQLTGREIIAKRNKGVVILVYAQRARELYELFKINYYFFFIESMGGYENSLQCYFNHMRRTRWREGGGLSFGSRGLFRVDYSSSSSSVEDSLHFVSENVDECFPPYKITAFDIEAARFDDKFPTGNTLLDRLCTVAFQTVTVNCAAQPRRYTHEENVIFIYLPSRKYMTVVDKTTTTTTTTTTTIYCLSEKELVQRVLTYISLANCGGIFITGWNIMKYDYRFIFNRAVYYNLVPGYITDYTFGRMCGMTEVFDMAPPWKLSIDTMECRKQFYPRHLTVNPPSNSIDATASALLPSGLGKTLIEITRINKIYWKMEKLMSLDEKEVDFMKQLVKYNIRDVQMVTDLNGVLQIVQTLVPLSALADLSPGDCINYNATKVCLTFMKNQFQSVMIAPIDYNVIYNRENYGLLYNKTGKYSRSGEGADLGKKGTYKGATVLEPEIGVHSTGGDKTKTLACFDFASLYPSIMRTFAIIRGYVSRISVQEYEADKDFYNTHFKLLYIPSDQHNVYLSLRNCVSSPIQYLCKSLIEKRKANKVNAPTVAAALKIITNSVYGLYGVKGVLFDDVAVSMVTGYGRECLLDVKVYFERNYNGLKVLYGDTDSIFVEYNNNHNESSTEMVSRYNQYLEAKYPVINALQLAVEAEFQCIIFIRKKLYMAKLHCGGYKLSGFPQRIDPKIHFMMMDALHGILEIVIHYPREQLSRLLEQFYQELFDRHTTATNTNINKEGGGGGGGGGDDFFNLKVKDLDSYKSRTSKHYHVGLAYEKSTGIKIHDVAYISVCEVVPLVRKLPRKSFCLCLESDYDDSLYCMNRSASLTEFLSKTFDPILLAIVDNSKSEFTLKQLSQKYVETLHKESILKHIANAFGIYDFSDCVCRNQPLLLKITTKHLWPEFYKQFVSNRSMRGGSSHAIPWVLEDSGEEEKKNIRLNIMIHSKNGGGGGGGGGISYATLCNGPPPLFAGIERRYYNLTQLGKLMRELVKDPHVLSRIYVNICNPPLTNDSSSLADILKLIRFIYPDKSLTPNQIANIDVSNDKFIILLPFITVKKRGKNEDLLFSYF